MRREMKGAFSKNKKKSYKFSYQYSLYYEINSWLEAIDTPFSATACSRQLEPPREPIVLPLALLRARLSVPYAYFQ